MTFDPVENLARAEPQAVRVTALLAVQLPHPEVTGVETAGFAPPRSE